jgi:hypothetical protein
MFTKDDSPWLKAQREKKLLEAALKNCTWCEGHYKETHLSYWECDGCGKYMENYDDEKK